MTKIEDERNILKIAYPILAKIYGQFKEDASQIDKPDAAITLNSSNPNSSIQIGIEITSVDRHEDQQYLRDEKFIQKETSKQIAELIQDGTYSKQPLKKTSIIFDNQYIYSGVIKKRQKYENYASSKKYHEIIILAFSDHMTKNNKHFNSYHRPWANFLLSKCNFPFDKVIFVCKETKTAILIFDKNNPKLDAPERNLDNELGITEIKSGIIPVGKTINLNEIINNNPVVPKGKKSKK